MIIDFHTHIFPQKIAEKTVELLGDRAGITAFSDGTAEGLRQRLKDAGADIGISLPVVTNPAQFDSINGFAMKINEDFSTTGRGILSFGGIHPMCDDIRGKMRRIKEMGFLGIKLHPDYQGVYFDDESYVEIIKAAADYDLIAVTHAGVDCGFPGQPVKCTPDRVLSLLKRVPHKKLVLAHMGGNKMFSEVYEKLAGLDVYFDTAYVLRYVGCDMFKKILDKHGEDKILFASDSPWSDIKKDIEALKGFGLCGESESKILGENAAALLGIK